MATQNLIQYLEAGTSGVMNRSKYETFLAGGAITKGQVVSLDLSKSDADRVLYVVPADTDTATTVVAVGIAVEAAAADEKVKVCIGGYCEDAVVSTSTAQGDVLQIGATAGQLEVRTISVDEAGSATFDLFPIVAQALEDDTAGVADVFVFSQFS